MGKKEITLSRLLGKEKRRMKTMADARPSKRQKAADDDDNEPPASESEAEEAPGVDTRRALTVAWLDPEKEADFDASAIDVADESDDNADEEAPTLPAGVEMAARPLFTHQLFDEERVEGYEGKRGEVWIGEREGEKEREKGRRTF
jgi:hypothetical protein